MTVTTVYVLCIYSLAILDTTHLELCEQERILEYSLDRFDEVRLQRSGVLLLGVTRHQELLQRLVTFVWNTPHGHHHHRDSPQAPSSWWNKMSVCKIATATNHQPTASNVCCMYFQTFANFTSIFSKASKILVISISIHDIGLILYVKSFTNISTKSRYL